MAYTSKSIVLTEAHSISVAPYDLSHSLPVSWCSLLALPYELRVLIWRHVLTITPMPESRGIPLCLAPRFGRTKSVLCLLLVNRQIHDESYPLFYRHNILRLDSTTQLYHCLTSLSPRRRACIVHLEIARLGRTGSSLTSETLRHWSEKAVASQALALLPLCTNLRQLSLAMQYIHQPCPTACRNEAFGWTVADTFLMEPTTLSIDGDEASQSSNALEQVAGAASAYWCPLHRRADPQTQFDLVEDLQQWLARYTTEDALRGLAEIRLVIDHIWTPGMIRDSDDEQSDASSSEDDSDFDDDDDNDTESDDDNDSDDDSEETDDEDEDLDTETNSCSSSSHLYGPNPTYRWYQEVEPSYIPHCPILESWRLPNRLRLFLATTFRLFESSMPSSSLLCLCTFQPRWRP